MQIFRRSTNALARNSVIVGVVLVGFLGAVVYMINASPMVTRQRVVQAQPVPFSHQHHVAGLGIDCRYCHTTVETGAFAGLPPTATCMNCHSQIWTNAALLEPVRASFRDNRSIRWNRVNKVPDFVQFNHSIHIAKGIGCVSCHGRVDQMPLMMQDAPFTMQWCLQCHRNPAKFVRPRETVFDMTYQPKNQAFDGPRLVKEYAIQSKTNCSVCHY